jgi:hypothetical protein
VVLASNRGRLSSTSVFKTVCVDAAYYTFPRPEYLQELADAVPDDFRFGLTGLAHGTVVHAVEELFRAQAALRAAGHGAFAFGYWDVLNRSSWLLTNIWGQNSQRTAYSTRPINGGRFVGPKATLASESNVIWSPLNFRVRIV